MRLNIHALFSRFKLLFITLGTLAITMALGNLIPIEVKSFFYAISLSIKNIIVFFLPLIIFVFLWHSLIALQNQAGKFIILLLAFVSLSNFIAIMTGYTVGVNILPLINFKMITLGNHLQLTPSWNLSLPQIISTKTALLASIALGLFFAFKPNQFISHIAQKINKLMILFFKKYFTPILPLFILGFLFKLEHEKALSGLIISYGPILLLIITTQVLYVFALYMAAADFKISKYLEYTKNMAPANITAFSTSSSAATLPVTIVCVEKNLKDENFARIITTATCNIHTLGSAVGLTIMALATLKAFNMGLPDIKSFIDFAIYYTLAKYAVAGVPGGVIVVAAPLLETYLGFTPEMIGMITTTYLLFDSCGTAANVSCNGAFAIIFSKIYKSKIVDKVVKFLLKKIW